MADVKIREIREWHVTVTRAEGDDWPDYQEPYGGPVVRPTGLRFTVSLRDGELGLGFGSVDVSGNRVRKDGTTGAVLGRSHFVPATVAFHVPYVKNAIAQIASGAALLGAKSGQED